MRPPRRQFLAGAVAGWSGLAGCSFRGKDDGGTPTPAGTVADLSYDAEVREQPSAETPASIRTMLVNRGDATVRVEARETIALDFEYGPERAVLYPETPVGPNEAPSEPDGSCWRYTDDDFLVRDIAVFHEIDPDGAFTETYRVYTWGEERSCLPEGAYGFAETVRDGQQDELEVRVELTVDGGFLAVEGVERRPQNGARGDPTRPRRRVRRGSAERARWRGGRPRR